MPDLTLTANQAEIRGPLRFIVRSAHKWGGNGTVPDFNKIRAVLVSKHPEVIAKAFGGDPDKAAAWMKDAWEKYYGRMLPGKTRPPSPTNWRGKGKGGSTEDDATMSMNPFDSDEEELFLADGEEPAQDAGNGELWYPVCRTGSWQRSPLPGGKPLQITLDRLRTWKDSFDQGAWENVTLPLTHKDETHENTGFVTGLDIRPDPKRPGGYKLWAKHKFTEPDILAKVQRGTIRGRSVGVAVKGLRRTSDGRFFPEVLKHVCLTNHPWLDGLNDEPLAASWKPEEDLEMFDDGDDEFESDALALAWGMLLAKGADPDHDDDGPDDADPDEGRPNDDGGPQVLGHVLAATQLGNVSAGEYVIPHAEIQKQSGAGLNAARDADDASGKPDVEPDADDASAKDLPDMPPGVHHVEGDHPTMKKHKLLTHVATGQQRALPNRTTVTPFVPYIQNASGGGAGEPDPGFGYLSLAADGEKHAFRGPRGEKCKVCGKSYGDGNHFGSEEMNAARRDRPVLRLRVPSDRPASLALARRRRGMDT